MINTNWVPNVYVSLHQPRHQHQLSNKIREFVVFASLWLRVRVCLVTPRSVMADMKLAMREQATGSTPAPRSAIRNSRPVFCCPPLNLPIHNHIAVLYGISMDWKLKREYLGIKSV